MKAVVLEVRGREAALLMADGTVRKARGDYKVGQEIEFYEIVRSGPRQWVAAVVIAAILLAGSVGMWINGNYVAYAEVSLDVNPSIVYTLNLRNRVLSVRAANGDAEDVVQALDGLRFKPIGEAVGLTLQRLGAAGYLDGEDDCLLASVSADDEERRESLAGQVETAIEDARQDDPGLEYRVDRTDRATARAARENGMSAGRYATWQQAGDGQSPEEYAEMPVRQLLGGGKPEAPQEEPTETPREEHPEAPQEAQPEAQRNEQPEAPKTEQPEAPQGEKRQEPQDAQPEAVPAEAPEVQPKAGEDAPEQPQSRSEGGGPEAQQPRTEREKPAESPRGGGDGKPSENRDRQGGGGKGGPGGR